jgi:hypothetical protein
VRRADIFSLMPHLSGKAEENHATVTQKSPATEFPKLVTLIFTDFVSGFTITF